PSTGHPTSSTRGRSMPGCASSASAISAPPISSSASLPAATVPRAAPPSGAPPCSGGTGGPASVARNGSTHDLQVQQRALAPGGRDGDPEQLDHPVGVEPPDVVELHA